MSLILPTRFGNASGAPPTDLVCGLPLGRFTYAKQAHFSNNTRCFDFAADGKSMFTGVAFDRSVQNFDTTGSGWEIDEFNFYGQFNPDQWTQIMQHVFGITVSPDGSTLWISGSTGLVVGTVASFDLITPYKWNSTTEHPTRTGFFFTNALGQIKTLNDISIKDDGKVLMGFGNDSQSFLYQYNLTSAWDVNTSVFIDNSSPGPSAPRSFVPASGDCLYRTSGTLVQKYLFGTPWDITTLVDTIVDSFDFSAQCSSAEGVWISADRMFILQGGSTGNIYQYNSGAVTYEGIASYEYEGLSSPVLTSSVSGMSMSTDGTTLVTMKDFGSNETAQFTLSTPWNISTAGSKTTQPLMVDENVNGAHFRPDTGLELWSVNNPVGSTILITKWALDSPFSIAGTPTSTTKDITALLPGTGARGIFVKPDGLKLWVVNGSILVEFDMVTPWDVSSLTYATEKQISVSYGLSFSPDGRQLYTAVHTQIHSRSLSAPWDISTLSTTANQSIDAVSTGNFAEDLFFRVDGNKIYTMDAIDQKAWQFRKIGT